MKFCIGILIILLSACTVTSQQSNRYQVDTSSPTPANGPVAELQRKAIAALAYGTAGESIDYLQRAIKIEPRNALSWHYLAKSYFQQKNFDKCLAMLQRSISYSRSTDNLDAANQALNQQCQAG